MSRTVLAVLTAGLVLAALPTQAAGPYQYHSLTPCRLADTRNADGPSGGPNLTDGVARGLPRPGAVQRSGGRQGGVGQRYGRSSERRRAS